MPYIRITVIGSVRKADIALPDDHPVGELVPEIIDLLDEPASGPTLSLSSLVGVPTVAALGFAEQNVANGAVLRLVPVDAEPLPPEVADVTEAVADAAVLRPDRWNRHLTTVSLGAAIALAAATTAAVLPLTVTGGAIVLSTLFVLAALFGAVLARQGRHTGAVGLFSLCAGVSLPLAAHVAALMLADPQDRLRAVIAVAWALIWLAAVAVFGAGGRRTGIAVGAAIALVTSATVAVSLVASAPVTTVAAVGGILAAVVLGVAPPVALATAGVTRFDDAAIDGEPAPRSAVAAAVDAAFSTQTSMVLAVAFPLAVAVAVLLDGDGWAQALAVALIVFPLARSRLFPLAVARMSVLLAAAVPAAYGLWLAAAGASVWPVVTGTVACALLVFATLARPSAAARARLRRLLSLCELFAVIAMVPLLLGVMGVFDDLLGAFG